MKIKLLVVAILIGCSFPGCILSKHATDKAMRKHVANNPSIVKEAAEFAVSITLNKSQTEFFSEDVQNKKMREKIASLGSYVTVTYSGNDYEIPDSNVTFKTITLFGVAEIVYDFAAKARVFADQTENKKQYYFVKLAERIYYRRRPVPMM